MQLPEFKRKLARRVRQLRESKEYRQDDLEDFGLAWKSVQKIEYGLTDPKASTLLKLSKAFDMSVAQLLEFER